MPIKNYGLLKGKAIDVREGGGQNPHYQVHLADDEFSYRIAINIQSALSPSELEYIIVDNFNHPIIPLIEELPLGFTPIDSKPGSMALDFIRGNLFDRKLMKILPPNLPGPDNDLNDKIQRIMQRAMANEDALIYAFGERWGPEPKKDKYFAFTPGNGIHDIHMNQSNVGKYTSDDGVWQDGGLLISFPDQNEWIGVFLKFQSQGWHTDDSTGHALGENTEYLKSNSPGFMPEPLPTSNDPQGLIKIVGALVNGKTSPEVEQVTVINVSSMNLAIDGWALLDTQERKQSLKGTIEAGHTKTIKIEKPLELSNQGGLITLINEEGLKVDGVSYTKKQASYPGWTILF
jgi:uncharacterized protein YukJ